MTPAVQIVEGPKGRPDSLTRLAQYWVRSGMIPAPPDWASERRTVAAVAILASLFETAGVHDESQLALIFDRLTSGEAPLIDAILADAREGSPVLVLTHWSTVDGRSATSFVFKLTAGLDEPITAPGDEWHVVLEGVMSLAPLFDKIVDATVVPFETPKKKKARR